MGAKDVKKPEVVGKGAIATREQQEQAVGAPREASRPRGLEEMDREDFVIPRLQIAQKMSPEIDAQSPMHMDNLKEGDLFNTVTREIYGKSVMVIPLKFMKSRVLFNPRESGGGIRCVSANGIDGGTESPTCDVCPHSRWGTGKQGRGQACTNFKNVASLIVHKDGHLDLISVSMKSTAIKVSKRWATLMNLRSASAKTEKDRDIFSGIYTVKTVPQKNAQGSFFNYDVDNAKVAKADEAQYAFALGMYETLGVRKVQVDMSGLDHGDVGGGDDASQEM